ncbi:BMC domain-containing protein [Radiobacillus sp. PE A8.2]|uniref:BMC domain-containing protein n=1 Tax=Radiobacillus sp. PE A8.2 TaxID=3380349 RepID=UPI00388D9EF0
MKKYDAIGIIETQYFPVAMEILDNVCKAANVEFLSSEKYLGGKLVSIIIGGKISDVSTAIEVAKQTGARKPGNPLKKALVITNPHEEILKFVVPPSAEPKKTKRKPKNKPALEQPDKEHNNE